MIRGAVYPIDLGDAKRGHEQRGRRLGLVIGIEQDAWSTVTVLPTSTSAQASVFRPEVRSRLGLVADEALRASRRAHPGLLTRHLAGGRLPAEHRRERTANGQFLPERRGFSRPADRTAVRDAIGQPGTTLVDVRSTAEYPGERFSPSGGMEPGGRAGHVPPSWTTPET